MKPKQSIAITKNIKRFSAAFGDLAGRSDRVPGLGLVTGQAGTGKTTATTYVCNTQNAVYVTATPFWTSNSMLAKILAELGINPGGATNARMHDLIIERLRMTNRAVLVDEADHLFDNSDRRRLVEGLRSLHDHSNVPIVLIGMEHIRSKLHRYPQLSGRISRSVDFSNLDPEDTRLVLDAICDVQVDVELAELVCARTKGSLRLVIVAAETVESEALAQGWETVTPRLWGNRALFPGDRG